MDNDDNNDGVVQRVVQRHWFWVNPYTVVQRQPVSELGQPRFVVANRSRI
jgi:hypothetical protein